MRLALPGSLAPIPIPLLAVASLLVTADALAQAGLASSSAPIEITSDTLEVRQNQRIATFTGEVDAVQGDVVLSADQLRVHYRGNAEIGQAEGSSNSIRRIEASGNVFLSSPEETAQGDEGVYEVATRIVTLEGQVVLTKGQNIIRGERLEYNLDTGRSQVFAAAKGGDEAAPNQRVRAVFVPNDGADAGEAEMVAPRAGAGATVAKGNTPTPTAEQPAPAAIGGGTAATPASEAKGTATWPPRPPQPKPALDG